MVTNEAEIQDSPAVSEETQTILPNGNTDDVSARVSSSIDFRQASNQPASVTPPPRTPPAGQPNFLAQFFALIQEALSGNGGLAGLFNNMGGFNGQGMLADFGNKFQSNFNISASNNFISPPSAAAAGLTPLVDNQVTEADVSQSWVQESRQGFVDNMRSLIGEAETHGVDNGGVAHLTGTFNRLPWCASLITNQIQEFFPNTIAGAHCLTIKAQAEEAGAFEQAGNGYIPQPGDLWITDRGLDDKLGYGGDGKGHMGMVSSVDVENGTYTVIEGNVGIGDGTGRDGVVENTYNLADLEKDRVFGFVNTVDAHLARNETTPEMAVETAQEAPKPMPATALAPA